MFKEFKHWFKTILTFNKSEQRGVLILLSLLLLLLAFNLLLPKLIKPTYNVDAQFKQDVQRFVSAQNTLQDSLEFIHLQNAGKLTYAQTIKHFKPFVFDPNLISMEQWEQIGLTRKQANSIMHYRAKGGRFHKKSDLKKIYGLSEVEYQVLEPFIQINKSANSITKKERQNLISSKKNKLQVLEINECDSADLVADFHLKPWLVQRLIKYRKLLGGFYCAEQLKEVYGLKSSVYNKISLFVIVDTSHLQKINLNKAEFKTVLHHPYFSYKTTQKLFTTRFRLHGFTSLDQVKEQTGIPDSTFRKIRHYLYIRPLKN